MIIAAAAIPVILEWATLTGGSLAAYFGLKRIKNFESISDEELQSALHTDVQDLSERVTTDLKNTTDAISDFWFNLVPDVNENVAEHVTVTNPTTMPEYLKQQNEMIKDLSAKTIDNTKHINVQNQILTHQNQILANTSASQKLISDALINALPAFILQLQQLAKIPSIMKINSDIGVAYNELTLEHQEAIRDLKSALNSIVQEKELSVTNEVPTPAVNVESPSIVNSVSIPDQSVALNNLKEATQAHTQELAKQTAELSKTAEATLSVKASMLHVADNAVSQKVIADYQQTEAEIKNLDGNVVTTAKPMELRAKRDAVNARNETDEMEFELDDEILGGVFSDFELPTFTRSTLEEDEAYAFSLVREKISNIG